MNNSQYTLSYLPQFYVDFSNAVLYIKNELQNPTAAKKLVGEVKKAIEKRLPNCEAFEPYISKHERRYKYYRVYLRSYTIYYVVIDDDPSGQKKMEVRRLLGNRQNVSEII